MFSEREADVTVAGEADGLTVKQATATGASASASISPTAGHTLVPVRVEAFGTAPTRQVSHTGGPTTLSANRGMSRIVEGIAATLGDGSTDITVDGMTATNDSDAASGDTAKVVAYEINVAATES